MTEIHTERLTIVSLTQEQLSRFGKDSASLGKDFNCRYAGEEISDHFRKAIERQCEKIEKDPDNIIWYTLWLIIVNDCKTIIGSISIKDLPNENGEVEIGYGLAPEFEHHGYMTETVKGLCEWLLKEKPELTITAQTFPDNQASQRVLTRCGFVQTGIEEYELLHENLLQWKLLK